MQMMIQICWQEIDFLLMIQVNCLQNTNFFNKSTDACFEFWL